MVFSFLTFQSGVVMCLMVVRRRLPSSSHSSSTSILVLSPFLFSVASHSFWGGAHPLPEYAALTALTPGAGAMYDFGAAPLPAGGTPPAEEVAVWPDAAGEAEVPGVLIGDLLLPAVLGVDVDAGVDAGPSFGPSFAASGGEAFGSLVDSAVALGWLAQQLQWTRRGNAIR